MTSAYRTLVRKNNTPQTEKMLGMDQVQNNAGGWGFPVTDWVRLERFVILSSEQGTYYVGERKLTKDNAEAVIRCLREDGVRVVETVRDISTQGRAPKNESALFVMALALTYGDRETKEKVIEVLPEVARTGMHLLHFVSYADSMRGWGKYLREAVANWYNGKTVAPLAYQMLKYQNRDGWTQRDVLRLAHVKPVSEGHNTLFGWAVKNWENVGDKPHDNPDLRQIWAAEKIKGVKDTKQVAKFIREYRIPREAVPTELLNDKEIAQILMEDAPITSLIRNLATYTRNGVLTRIGKTTNEVVEKITNVELLRKGRVHPITILSALRTYAAGKGERSNNTWEPVPKIIDALNEAFYTSFGVLEKSDRKVVIGIDVSGSMHHTKVNGLPNLGAYEGAAIMAMALMNTVTDYAAMAFDTRTYPLTLSPKQRLDDIIRTITRIGGGGTNCALPITWAMNNKIEVDAIILLTDSETYAGDKHVYEAMLEYRKRINRNAKLVVVQMTATNFSLVCNEDANMLNVIGLDSAVPQLITDFLK